MLNAWWLVFVEDVSGEVSCFVWLIFHERLPRSFIASSRGAVWGN